MPVAAKTSYLVISDNDGNYKTAIVPARGEGGELLYGWELAPPIAPSVTADQLGFGQYTPDLELVWSQSDWSRGALQFYYKPSEASKYGIADKVWAITPSEVSLGLQPIPIPFMIANGGLELGATTGWSASGCTIGDVATTAPFAGKYHLSVTGVNTNDYVQISLHAIATQLAEALDNSETAIDVDSSSGISVGDHIKCESEVMYVSAIDNNTLTVTRASQSTSAAEHADNTAVTSVQVDFAQSSRIDVTAKVRGASVAGGQVRIQIIESGGSSTPTTNGTAVTLTTSYQTVTAGVSLQSDSTGVVIRVEMSNEQSATRSIYVDELNCQVTASAADGKNANNLRMVMMGSTLVCVTDRALYTFNDAKDYWVLAKVFSADVTGIEVFDNRIYIGQGSGTAYAFSNANDVGTWTNAGSSGNKANYFIKTLNAAGNYAMGKTLNEDDFHLTTDPTGSPSYGTAIEVGTNDKTINNVYQLDGTIGIGKSDGFYRYMSLEGNRFVNVYPGAESAADADNFSRGIMYNGWFYTTMSEVGLLRYNGTFWQDLSHLLRSPGFTEFGNRVRAFGTDGKSLYTLVESLDTSSISKTMWLYAMREYAGGEWDVHQVCSMPLTDANDIHVFKTSGASNSHIYVSGELTTGEAYSYRMTLPNQADAPRLAANKDMALSGDLITAYWDGDRPGVDKAFNKLTILSESLSSNQTITVYYQVDNDTSWTKIHASYAEFTRSPLETVGFTAGVTGKRIRLKFSFASNVATGSPILKGFALHTSWRPKRLRRWRIVASLEDDIRMLQGVRHSLPVNRMLSNIGVLRQLTEPVILDDIDGNSHKAHIVEVSERQYRTRSGSAGTPRMSRVIEMVLTEVLGAGWGYVNWDEFNWE